MHATYFGSTAHPQTVNARQSKLNIIFLKKSTTNWWHTQLPLCYALLLRLPTGCNFFIASSLPHTHLPPTNPWQPLAPKYIPGNTQRFTRCTHSRVGRVSSVGIATVYWLDGPGIESRWGVRFSAPLQTGPGVHPDSCTMGTGSFPEVKSGQDVRLTQATGRQHRRCIIPQTVTHSLVLLKMSKIISWNMLSWLELLISRYCCI